MSLSGALYAASMARRDGGRPARIGMVTPGKTTTSRRGRTGRCSGSLRTVLVVVSVIGSPWFMHRHGLPGRHGRGVSGSVSLSMERRFDSPYSCFRQDLSVLVSEHIFEACTQGWPPIFLDAAGQ